jgi:hypothetical protein
MTKIAVLAVVMTLGACGRFGEGDVIVSANGEQGAREGFPYVPGEEGHVHMDGEPESDEVAFADGWEVRFDRYLASVGDLELATLEGEVAAASEAVYVFDLTQPRLGLEELVDVHAQRWDDFSYSVRAPAAGETVKLSGGATEEDAAMMRTAGINYYVEGYAEKDGRVITFAWGIDNPTDNVECTNGADETAGIVVKNNATAQAELTFHVEHMFWDRLGSEQTRLRFEAIAAMADADGEVTWASLAQQMLANLRDEAGGELFDDSGNRVVYDPGSSSLPRNDLQQFILASVRTQAHLNGSGLCTISAR